ncbi:MAG: serine/threonine-protein kinase [Polyangia bacterium]
MIGQYIGGYRILRVLGEGGMGVVYEGVREDIGGSAAIKVLRSEYALQPELAARFFNEARAANLVNHPGIVKVFDYGQLPSGVAFLAMEFLEGESLYKRLQREARLSEAESLRLGRQIASALAAAHEKQVVHRDLKPENVFIVPDAEAAGGERAKILDFGIAKLTAMQQGPVRTNTNMLMGTPIYMSPENITLQLSDGDHRQTGSWGLIGD